ncbi:ATP-binding protein [Spirosoma sordidisoli]|nr:ATP-binding protein [Spirosoma sordidisoli]
MATKNEVTYQNIFTPGSPPVYSDMLIGREEEASRLLSILESSGQYPFVLGPRGIGKTSLVKNSLPENFIQIEVNTVANFTELSFAILNECGLNISITNNTYENQQVGKIGGKFLIEASLDSSSKTTSSEKGIANAQFNAYMLESEMRKIKDRKIIFLDEMDTLDNGTKHNLVSLIKAISNKSDTFPHKFVFAGIGKEVHSIFGEHPSISRNITPIYLKPLDEKNIFIFLSKAEEHLQLQIPDKIKKIIAIESLGQPYYAQQVGFYMLEEFNNDKSSKTINIQHYLKGKERAFESAFSSLLFKYKFTFYKLSVSEKEILKALIRFYKPTKASDIYKQLLSITNLNRASLEEAVHNLSNKEYITIRQSDQTLLFKESLLLPFLKTRLGEQKTDQSQLFLDF